MWSKLTIISLLSNGIFALENAWLNLQAFPKIVCMRIASHHDPDMDDIILDPGGKTL
jgi:hypothetical protein